MNAQYAWSLFLLLPASSSAQATEPTPERCEDWAPPSRVGELTQTFIHESSGLAQSRNDPTVWFTLNDSGSDAQVHAFRLDGSFLGTSDVIGAENIDWEAMASGPCPTGTNSSCLYVGDIGDNDRERDSIRIYVFPEPEPGESARLSETWNVVYPDEPHDAEALLVHPLTGEVTLITKSGSGRSQVFSVPNPSGNTVRELTLVAELSIIGINSNQRKITGGSWNANGSQIVLRNYLDALVWVVDPCDPHAHWNQAPTQRVPVGITRQGEAIAFEPTGDIIITSEGVPMPILRTACEQHVPLPDSSGTCDP